ncbi:MAG: hypothetical protein K6G72_03435 [Lachnospiraceae bacterium]|nr:hypothetical protein [Lachnospiraceae bacterium]
MDKGGRVAYILLITGLLLVIGSSFAFYFFGSEKFAYTVISYSIFGGGFGLLGDGIGRLNAARLEKKDPERMRMVNIEKNDERNIAIDEKARAKAFTLSQYLFSAVLVALAIMRVDLKALLLVLAADLLTLTYSLYIRLKLYKEM